jgi:hypothetical protein
MHLLLHCAPASVHFLAMLAPCQQVCPPFPSPLPIYKYAKVIFSHRYCGQRLSSRYHANVTDNAADAWLTAVCRGAMAVYLTAIWAVSKLSSKGSRQLCTDLGACRCNPR